MTEQELIKRAIESAKCRIYRVRANVGESLAHQIKADNQAEIMQVTIDALEKQIAKNWIAEYIGDGEFIWTCPVCKETFALMDGTPQDNEYNYCPSCGQALAERKICCSNCRELYEEYGMKLCKIYEEPQENIDTECCEHHTLDWGNEDAE